MGGTTNCGASSLEYCTSTSAGESAVARMAVLVEQVSALLVGHRAVHESIVSTKR
jgi:hypothetical protein